MGRTAFLCLSVLLLSASALLLSLNGCSGSNSRTITPGKIQHVVVIFQENRTPDNLFHDSVLISRGADIASSGTNSKGQTIPLSQIDLANAYDLSHVHSAFVSMYDGGKMDGAEENIKSSNKDESEVTNTILSKTNTLFDRLLDSLSGSSGKAAPSDSGKNQLAPDSGSPTASPTSPSPVPSLLSTIMAGRELRRDIDGTSQILYVGFNAAGGSYRVLHNFWIELFWRTPRPAFNGGAVASYILFNPDDSTVAQARTLRFACNYSKFGSKKMTQPDNFLPDKKDNTEPQPARTVDGCSDIDPPKKKQ